MDSMQALREAARRGDYGRVVRLARGGRGVSQRQLGDACGVSQSAISRLEGRGPGPYDMTLLARAAVHLDIPRGLVGLAEYTAGPAPVTVGRIPAQSTGEGGGSQAAALRSVTDAFRRLDGTTPARELSPAVHAHLRLARSIAQDATPADRTRLAAAGSEVASFAGWLAWDMGDHGSARTWYGSAVTAACRSADPLLCAYQLGSLAQFEALAGNAPQGLALAGSARRQLGDEPPAIADAWLWTVEALGHATAGNRDAADQALVTSGAAAARLTGEAPPPWPWVFRFTPAKVAACRITCGAMLGEPAWVFPYQEDAAPALASGHERQRALQVMDLAQAHLAAGRPDVAFALGAKALETGVRYRSGRLVERARALRRAYPVSSPPRVVRDFDDRLYGLNL